MRDRVPTPWGVAACRSPGSTWSAPPPSAGDQAKGAAAAASGASGLRLSASHLRRNARECGQRHAQHDQEQAGDEQIRCGQIEDAADDERTEHQEPRVERHSQNRPGHGAASSRPPGPATWPVHRCRDACVPPATGPASMPRTGGPKPPPTTSMVTDSGTSPVPARRWSTSSIDNATTASEVTNPCRRGASQRSPPLRARRPPAGLQSDVKGLSTRSVTTLTEPAVEEHRGCCGRCPGQRDHPGDLRTATVRRSVPDHNCALRP